jgi:hypothetical protein
VLEHYIRHPVMQDFRELKVWQKAHELTLAVYKITAFPREELYGLTATDEITQRTTEVKRMLTAFRRKPRTDD